MLCMDCVLTDFDGKTDQEVIATLADKLYENGLVKDSYKDAVLEREKKFPTGLPVQDYGVAIPHADSIHIIQPSLAIAKLRHPIKFGKMGGADGETVDVNVVIMMGIRDDKDQLPMIVKILDLFSDESKIKQIKDAKTITELHDLFVGKILI